MKPFDLAIADTREAAVAALADGWTPKAGGIDLLDRLKERVEAPDRLVAIHRLADLRAIATDGDGFTAGALATLRDLATHDALLRRAAVLAEAAGDAATPQLRAVATLGGNLCQRPRCWYFRHAEYDCLKKGGATCFAVEGDNSFHALFQQGNCHIVHPSNVGVALLALDATIDVESSGGGRRSLAAADFFVGPDRAMHTETALAPGDLLVRVRVPAATSASAYVAIKQRQSFDWPLASCGAARLADGWRVALGHVAPTPRRAPEAEALLGTATMTPDLAARAADAAVADAAPMSRNAWRVPILRAAVRRALLRAAGLADTDAPPDDAPDGGPS